PHHPLPRQEGHLHGQAPRGRSYPARGADRRAGRRRHRPQRAARHVAAVRPRTPGTDPGPRPGATGDRPVSTPAPADLPIRVPITWSEILRTPDGSLRRLLAGRYRNAVHDIRTHAATQAIEPAPENTGPPEPAEVAHLRTSIAALADRARRIRQAKYDDTD